MYLDAILHMHSRSPIAQWHIVWEFDEITKLSSKLAYLSQF